MKMYRARGKYDLSNRESWVTNRWRRTKAEAELDVKVFTTGRYKDVKIIEKDYNKYIKKHQRVPKF